MNNNDDDDLRVTHIDPRRRKGANNFMDQINQILNDIREGIGGQRTGGNGSGGGGHPRSGGFSGDSRQTVLVIAGLVLLVWGALTSFYTVDISEEGVITRFGAYNRTTPSGMHFKIPFGIEDAENVQSKRILQEEFGFRTKETTGDRSVYDKASHAHESLMLTGDLNVADVEWILQYRIADPWKFLFHARDVKRNIRDVSMSIMRRVVGDRLVGDVLTTGRVEIADQAKILTQEVLDQYDMGIRVEKIILQGVNPPEKVKPSFNEVNAAKQEQEQTINVAEREYNRVVPEARGKAEKVQADAQGYAIEIVNRALGNATQFEEVLQAYKQAPEITRRRLYLDTMEEIFANASGFTIVDSQVKGFSPIYSMPGVGPSTAAAASQARPDSTTTK